MAEYNTETGKMEFDVKDAIYKILSDPKADNEQKLISLNAHLDLVHKNERLALAINFDKFVEGGKVDDMLEAVDKMAKIITPIQDLV